MGGLCLSRSYAAEGQYLGVDVGLSEPANGNYRGHVRTGGTANPFVGYMWNRYLGVQAQLHFTAQTPDTDPPRNDHSVTTLFGATVGPRMSVPLWRFLALYGTAQGGVFTGLSRTVDHTAAGFSVGGGLVANITSDFSFGVFSRWNRAYMSAHPDLGITQTPGERGHDDIKWITVGVGLQVNLPPAWVPPLAPPLPAPPPPPVAQSPPPVQKKIVLRAVYFDTNRAVIRADAKPVLDEAAEILKEAGSVAVVAEGHTDSTGSELSNTRLSQRRASAVRAYLIKRGVAGNRITTAGYGASRPVASNDTAEGRAQNRRVELHVR